MQQHFKSTAKTSKKVHVYTPSHPREFLSRIEQREKLARGTLSALWSPQQGKYKTIEAEDLLREFLTECVKWRFPQSQVAEALQTNQTTARSMLIKYGGHVPRTYEKNSANARRKTRKPSIPRRHTDL